MLIKSDAVVEIVNGHGRSNCRRRLDGIGGGGRVGRDYVGDWRGRKTGAPYEQSDRVAARLDAVDGLAVRHLVGVVAVDFKDLVAYL